MLERESVYQGAARMAMAAAANSLKPPLPVANPHIPRRRFSHAWIVAPCLLLLALPLLYAAVERQRHRARVRAYNAEAALYLPLEQKIAAAERKKEGLQARYQREAALQQQLAERRKPLAAFINVAYFFSKYAGDSVLLDYIRDTGAAILVSGVYSDPEDGLALNENLATFAAAKGLRITGNKVSEERDSEGAPRLRLDLSFDYQGLKD